MATKPKRRTLKAEPLASDQIEVWPLSRIKINPRNSRKHSAEQIEKLAASIEEYGQVWPVLVDEADMLIAGEGRYLGMQHRESATIKVLVARGWSDARKRAFLIADNKLGELSTWDRTILNTEVANLSLTGFDVSLLGFAPGEIKTMIANAVKPSSDPDDAPPVPKVVVSRLGDLWLLGAHRVLCGDATSKAAVERLLNGAVPFLMVTDPPYGVAYDPAWRGDVKNADGSQLSTGKNRAKGKVKNDDQASWRDAWALFPGVVAYVWHSGKHGTEVGNDLIAVKLLPRSQIIWVKSNFVVCRGDYHWGHEAAHYATKQDSFDDRWRFEDEHQVAAYNVKLGSAGGWRGGRKQSTVWDDISHKNTTGHGTQKPVEIMRRPIVNHTDGGEPVYDPFLGSGTTLIAAQMEGRLCYGLEIDPAYVDVIVERFEKFTGTEAVLEGGSKTFAQVRAARGKETKGRNTKPAEQGGKK